MLSLKVKKMADKTIKELADELGISKSKVNYQVSKLNTELITILDGVKYLNYQAQKEVRRSLGVQLNTKSNTLSNDFEQQFEHRLKPFEKQLEIKDKQIDTLQKLLDQQQQLTLQSNNRIEQLEAQLQIEPQAPEEKQPPAEESKTDPESITDKKWWHFLRRDS